MLEVLVAFAMLVLMLGAIYEAVALSSRTIRRTEHKAEALLVAQSQLAALATLDALTIGVRDGTTGQGTRWRVEVSAASAPDGQPWPTPVLDVVVTAAPVNDPAAAVTLTTRRLGVAP